MSVIDLSAKSDHTDSSGIWTYLRFHGSELIKKFPNELVLKATAPPQKESAPRVDDHLDSMLSTTQESIWHHPKPQTWYCRSKPINTHWSVGLATKVPLVFNFAAALTNASGTDDQSDAVCSSNTCAETPSSEPVRRQS